MKNATVSAVILAWSEPSNPLEIYDNHKDLVHQQNILHRDEQLEANDDIINLGFIDLHEKVRNFHGILATI